MPSTATITSKTGPGVTVTALVINNVTDFHVETYPHSLLKVNSTDIAGTREFDIQATTTFTCTISAGVCTLTISQ